MIQIISPVNGEGLPLLTRLHKDFLESGGNKASTQESFDYMNLYRQGVDNSFGEPVVLRWSCSETADNSFCVYLSQSDDFSECKRYETTETQINVYNLLLGTEYYWRVEDKNGSLSDTGHFKTEDIPPRWIRVCPTSTKEGHGITNVRDLGGWKCGNGGRIKQGMIFRGSEMDDHCVLTDYGRTVLLDDLKIKTDYDLRKKELTAPLGDSVRYIRIPLLGAYGEISEHKDEMRDMLKVFCDEANYPIYIHCWGGADRTGTLLFLLCAVLGMSKEDLFLEYELTSFSVWGPRSSDSELFREFKAELSKYGGDDIVAQSRNYVLSTGITEEDIAKLKQILLEQKEM